MNKVGQKEWSDKITITVRFDCKKDEFWYNTKLPENIGTTSLQMYKFIKYE